jgi:multidrug efflux pump subunit AcrA (membrane-fusion protein)
MAMNKLSPKGVLVLVAGLALLAALALWATRQRAASQPTAADKPASAAPSAPSAPAASRPALTVAVGQPEALRLPVTLAANGNIAAWQEAIISAETQGLRLQDLRAGVGDVVRAGQVLAVFASESVQADVAQAQAVLLEAQSNPQPLRTADLSSCLSTSLAGSSCGNPRRYDRLSVQEGASGLDASTAWGGTVRGLW